MDERPVRGNKSKNDSPESLWPYSLIGPSSMFWVPRRLKRPSWMFCLSQQLTGIRTMAFLCKINSMRYLLGIALKGLFLWFGAIAVPWRPFSNGNEFLDSKNLAKQQFVFWVLNHAKPDIFYPTFQTFFYPTLFRLQLNPTYMKRILHLVSFK